MQKTERIAIRLAGEADLVAINDIYNYYVRHSTCTYQEEPEPLEGRRVWLAKHVDRHPATVAEINGHVVGWGSLSPYHARSAFRFTVENSVYVHHEYFRRGVGLALLQDLLARAHAIGHRAIIAAIDADQSGSLALHGRCGFTHAGRLAKVGYKFEKWLDVIYMEYLVR